MTDATVTELRPSPAKGEAPTRNALRQRRYRKKRKIVTRAAVTPKIAMQSEAVTPFPAHTRNTWAVTVVTLTAALALATVSTGFSITGLTNIFVGAFWPVIGMGVALEAGKLSAVAWLGRSRGVALRAALAVLVVILMALNAIGAYGFLAKAHIDHAVAGEVRTLAHGADIDARLSVQAGVLTDIDRRVAQIDAAVDKATSKGRTSSAMALADQQRKVRSDLVAQRTGEARALAGLQVEKAAADGERRKVEADLGPVKYLATLLGTGDQDVLRYFILIVALPLDPAAVLLLLTAASPRRSGQSGGSRPNFRGRVGQQSFSEHEAD